jgi:hypothetical protein
MGRNTNLQSKKKGLEHVRGRKTEEENPLGNLELVECTHQPGNLKISPYACAQRYLLARKKSLFGMAARWSLETCGKCPEGRNRAEALGKNPDSTMGKGGQASRAKKRHRVDPA